MKIRDDGNSQERSFNDRFLENIIHERDKVMNCIREDTSLVGPNKVTAVILNRRGVSKEKLCVWLEVESMLTILNNKALPLLQETVPKADSCETLEAEKIKDQNTIIKLQSEVIKKKEVEISSMTMRETMQNTVKNEITSYVIVLSKSCAAALAPNKISKAMKSAVDRDDRKKNVIIYGVSETEGEVVANKVEEVLSQLNEKSMIKDCCRIGFKKPEAVRPIKFTVNSSDMAMQILHKSFVLRSKEDFRSVYVCPDRTDEERAAIRIERNKKKEVKAPFQYPSDD